MPEWKKLKNLIKNNLIFSDYFFVIKIVFCKLYSLYLILNIMDLCRMGNSLPKNYEKSKVLNIIS